MNYKRIIWMAIGIAVLLLIQFVAMQFTNEIKWSLFDFILAAILLLTTGLVLEILLRKIKTTKSRIVACVIILLILFLVWAELAVGIFGSRFSGS